jgi:hypothetical protein
MAHFARIKNGIVDVGFSRPLVMVAWIGRSTRGWVL